MEEIAFFIADEVDAIEMSLFLHEENHRRNVPKIPHFVENVVHLYSPSEFQSHFRLSRGHVEDSVTVSGGSVMSVWVTLVAGMIQGHIVCQRFF
ncbi:uncharacterized protein LOC127637930 isoform X12 [Xyrauchen texanus]|uniref:uncharacterized protein LOC127637930 isoform X12 n=1 Tax=Xyrauchen texanus TaxID=154827 RepID=UPI002241E9F5|nr:uncharacterized protein LOC127637930 isoform X12 [Xyrauchen texanus]